MSFRFQNRLVSTSPDWFCVFTLFLNTAFEDVSRVGKPRECCRSDAVARRLSPKKRRLGTVCFRSVAAVPAGGRARSVRLRALSALLQSSIGRARTGEATEGPSRLCVVADPVQVVVVLDRRVLGIEEDHFEPLLGAVFTDPVAVEDAEVAELPAGALLGDALDGLPTPDPVDALALRPTTGSEALLSGGPFSNCDASQDDALLGFVAELSCAVQARGPIDPLDRTLIAPLLLALPL